jgi:hypothetical protein
VWDSRQANIHRDLCLVLRDASSSQRIPILREGLHLF